MSPRIEESRQSDGTTQRDAFLSDEGNQWYERNAKNHKLAPHFEVFSRYVSGGNALEIGCAHGRHMDALQKSSGCKGFGIDPSEEAIRIGKTEHPALDLRVGSADKLPFPDAFFNFVYFGFCLYLIDRSLLTRVLAEADRVLKDKSYLGITDFDPLERTSVPYHHRPDIRTYKSDYSKCFTATHYSLVEKAPWSHRQARFDLDPAERVANWVLFKDLESSYRKPQTPS